MIWTSLDTWIVTAGALAGASCALVGSFLVLKKVSMMGDAISHAVLPGIAVAFILSGSRAGPVMFIGAAIVGVLTAILVEAVRRYGRLEQGASMGVVFTVLFAIGLILIERAARHVDIHPEHVLYGAVELVPLHLVTITGFGVTMPRGVLVLVVMLLVNIFVVTLLFKELRLATFDPELATTLGFNATAMHYLVMTLTALTTVAAFEVVGSILVIAMLIVPGATAHLLTRRLVPFLLVSVILAALSAVIGHLAAIGIPPLFGFEDTSTSGSMAAVLGLFFAIAFFAAPEHGLVARGWNQVRLRLSIVMQDVLGLLVRAGEYEREGSGPGGSLSLRDLRTVARSPFRSSAGGLTVALVMLRIRGLVAHDGGERAHRLYRLTSRGTNAAFKVLRTHRLWERFFYDEGRLELDELHPAADVLEHYTDAELREALARRFEQEHTDPRGRPIPE
jgi:manganese/zinc/iron transport system permease protein